MLTEVKNNLRYFISALNVNIKSAMAYKASFLVQTIFMVINNMFFLVFWKVVFSNTGDSTSITFNNVLFLWSFSTIAYGIAYFFFGGIQKISEYIITGTLDSFLLQPKNVLLNVITSKCNFSACGDLLYGIVIGIIATGGNIEKIMLLIGLGILGSIFFISAEVIIRSLAVWIGDTNIMANRYVEMLLVTFSTYPEDIFKIVIKIILYTVVPVAYLSYLPASLMEKFNVQILLLIILVAIIYGITAVKIFNKAIKNYESGNNMSMKN